MVSIESDGDCAAAALSSLRIVLIEDNPEDARHFEEQVRAAQSPVDVRWEQSLATGLDVLNDECPDVLVVDLGLPDSDGAEIVERCVRAVHDAPVVVLTGRDDLDPALAALEAGATEYLQKGNLTPELISRTLRWAVERRRMEETIAEHETWIRSITENIPNGVYRSMPGGDIIYANEAFVSMFGYEGADEMQKVDSADLYANSSDREPLLRREHERGSLDGAEVEFQRKDGSTFTGLLSSTVVRDENGTVQYYDGAVTDVTERKEAEQAVRRSEELHRATLSNITDAVFITRDDGTFTYVCPNVEHIFGRSQEEVEELGTISALLGSDPRVGREMDADGRLTNVEHTIQDASGRRHHLLVNVQRVSIQEGTLLYTCRDVTGRRETEGELRESQERLQGLANSIPGILYQFHACPDGTREFRYVSEQAESLLGLAPDADDLFEQALCRVPSSYRNDLRASIEAAVEEVQSWSFEFPFEMPSGETLWLLAQSHPERHEDELLYHGVLLDITDRKEAERQLRRHRDVLQQTQKLAGGWEYDVRTDTVVWTERVYDIYELPHDVEPTLERALAPFDPEGRKRLEAAIERSLEEGESYDLELSFTTANGNERWMRTVGQAFEKEGEVVRLAGAVQDVTERKQAEMDLRHERDLLQSIFDASPVAIVTYDTEGTVTHASARTEEVLGLAPERIRWRSYNEADAKITTPDGRTVPDEELIFPRVMATGERVFGMEHVIELSDGTRRWLSINGAPLREKDGTLAGVVAVFEDVTERREVEERLRLQASALEASANAIAITDRRGRMIWVNAAFTELTGYSEAEATGHTMRILNSGEQTSAFYKDLWDTIQSGSVWQGELINERKDGSHYVEEQTITPVVDESGRIQNFIAIKQDITERKETEKALRRSRNLLAKAQEIANLGSWERDMEVEEIYWSDETYRIFGWEPGEEITMEKLMMAVHPKDRGRLREQQKALIEEGTPIDVQYRIRRPGGEERIIHERGEAEFSDDGTPVRIYGTVYDVTKQKQAERTEARLAAIVQASPNAIISVGAEGTIQTWNDAATTLYGYTAEEAVGQPITIVVPRGQKNAFRGKIDQLLDGAAVGPLETKRQRKDGSCFDALVSAAPIQNEEGEIIGFAASVMDITEQKKAEEDLRRSRERWQRLIENMQDALEISVDGIVRYANPATADLVGADSPEEVIGEPIERFLPSEDLRAMMDERREQIESGEATEPYEHEIERFDGERRVVESYSVPVEYEGQSAAQTMVRDVTEQKQLESQLRRAQKMETVGTLAGGIAHDFNNILHSAMAYVQMSREDLSKDHVVDAYLSRTESGLEQAKELVRKLLTFSRPEDSATDERVDLAPLVRETLDLAEPSLPKGLDVRTDLADSCTVIGDAGQLRQVVMNLVANAGQAMADQDPGGLMVLDVRLNHVDVDLDLATQYLYLDTGRYVQLSVSDTGTGMDLETRERIFDPFFTTKESGEQRGMGLGLSVVHGIVQALGGEVTVHSQLGEGTTFDVYLPVPAAADDDPFSSAISDDAGREESGHVLVVDDEAAVTELESVRLPRFGYVVTTCASASEALAALEESAGSIDVVLTDYRMPGDTGVDLARMLRANDYKGGVVLMSGYSAQVSEGEARRAGVDAFVQKPVGAQTLQDVLVRVMRAKQ